MSVNSFKNSFKNEEKNKSNCNIWTWKKSSRFPVAEQLLRASAISTGSTTLFTNLERQRFSFFFVVEFFSIIITIIFMTILLYLSVKKSSLSTDESSATLTVELLDAFSTLTKEHKKLLKKICKGGRWGWRSSSSQKKTINLIRILNFFLIWSTINHSIQFFISKIN